MFLSIARMKSLPYGAGVRQELHDESLRRQDVGPSRAPARTTPQPSGGNILWTHHVFSFHLWDIIDRPTSKKSIGNIGRSIRCLQRLEREGKGCKREIADQEGPYYRWNLPERLSNPFPVPFAYYENTKGTEPSLDNEDLAMTSSQELFSPEH